MSFLRSFFKHIAEKRAKDTETTDAAPPPAVLQSITISPAETSIVSEGQQQFSAMGKFSDGSSRDVTSTVDWLWTNDDLISIDAQGLATALSATGPVEVTAMDAATGVTGSAKVTVTPGLIDPFASGAKKVLAKKGAGKGGPAPVLRIIMVFPAGKVELHDGEQKKFSAKGLYSAGADKDVTKKVAWSSSDDKIVSIDSSGNATAGANAGKATITAKDSASNVHDSVEVAVTSKTTAAATTGAPATTPQRKLKLLQLTISGSAMEFGGTQQLKAEGIYDDESVQDLTSTVTWSSSAPDIVAIDASGLATAGNKEGRVKLSAVEKLSGVSTHGMADVTQDGKAPEPDLKSLTVEPNRPKIIGGWQQQFTAMGKTYDRTEHEIRNVVWSSSAPDILTIDQNGLAIAQRVEGKVTVTATHKKSGVSDSTTVRVSWDEKDPQAPPLHLIRLTCPVTLDFGRQFHLKAHGIYADKTEKDLTYEIEWSTTAPDIVLIDFNGRATAGSKPGTARITATDKATGCNSYGMIAVVAPGAD